MAQGSVFGAEANQIMPRPVGYDTVDAARLKFIYEQTEVDTVLSRAQTEAYLLLVGDSYTRYASYNAYRLDSVCDAASWQLTFDRYGRLFFDSYPTSSRTAYLHNMRNDHFLVDDAYSFDLYIYEDSTAQFDWTLQPDTVTVCGYVCRKAEATFRGIRWTAWYAPEIPLGIGPWKFNGLPGLVLWAYDDKGTHDVRLTAARRSTGTPITFQTRSRFRAKRERVNTQMKKFKIGMQPYDSATGFPLYEIDKQGNRKPMPAVRRFYVPYELE